MSINPETIQRILHDWNNTDQPFSVLQTIHRLYEQKVQEQPAHIALYSSQGNLTYGELNKLANRFSGHIRNLGIKANAFAGILLPRSNEMIALLLAILKNGSAYVPLNITDPSERITKICETANIEYIITSRTLGDMADKFNQQVLYMEDLLLQSRDANDQNPDNPVDPTDAAYIIFTSGTTGTPKGVLVKHRPVINLIEWVNKTYEINQKDKLIWTTNLSFDLSVYDIFGILAAGASLRLLDDTERMDPEIQLQILLNEKITFWDSAPQNLQRIVPLLPDYLNHKEAHHLRLVFLSGDWIPLTLRDEIRSLFGNAQVVGLGGATEATVWSNYFDIHEINPSWKSIPYGKPIQNAKYYILDSQLNHCDILVPGDLYIGGQCLASEYYNDPELTSKKFIPDPFQSGSRLYFTGDLAQWMPDGIIEFLGRNDLQVKIRGYRVELGEIKQAILDTREIPDCILVPDKSDIQNITIFCFCLKPDQLPFDKSRIFNKIRGNLPEYMMPADIMAVDTFPMTSNGKIDTKALLEAYHNMEKVGQTELPPMNELEKDIYDIWVALLGHAGFSTEEDYKNIGGNSLFVYRFISRVKQSKGVVLSFIEMNKYPTISLLAQLIKEKQIQPASHQKIIPHKSTSLLPLSSQQYNIWLTCLINEDIPLYNENFTYYLKGPLQEDKLEEAFQILVNRHIIFHSTFSFNDQGPWCDLTPGKLNFTKYDFATYPPSTDALNRFIDNQIKKTFDFKTGPLYCFNLIKTGVDQWILQLIIHHIIFDGLSFQILCSELSEIYNSLLNNRKINLPETEITLYDFARWEMENDSVEQKQTSLAYWKSELEDMPTLLNFPFDKIHPNQASGNGGRVHIDIPPDISEGIRNLSKTYHCTLYVTMLGLFSILIKKYANQNDFCIGMPASSKNDVALENVIGMFVNTIPIRMRFEENQSITSIIDYLKRKTAASYDHQHLSYDKIVHAVNPNRSKPISTLFQVCFAWQEEPAQYNFDAISCSKYPLEDGISPFDLTGIFWNNGKNITGEFEFNTDVLTRETILRLKDHFLYLLHLVLKNPQGTADQMSLATPSEIIRINQFNQTTTSYPRHQTIAQLFEEQVVKYPGKNAITFQNQSITYHTLNGKANQLAHQLREKGITIGTKVALFSDKSLELFIGILAILKAGGAYVPIDPEYPEQRISFILSDSQCHLALTVKKYHSRLPAMPLLFLDESDLYAGNSLNPDTFNTPDDLAYMIYTSGTTGMPKGSLIPQKGVVRLVKNTNYIEFKPEDQVLQTSAIVFDASTEEIFGALLNGATLHVINKDTLLDIKALAELVENQKISVIDLSSALFTQIAELNTGLFRNVRTLVLGGDIVSAPHVNKLRREIPGITVVNTYGPTENSCNSTAYIIDKDFESNIPIGKPISNSTAYIFDRFMNLLPVGIKGELFVGGDGLSLGYLNREDLNKKSFVTHPLDPNQRLYKTGDLARWLPDGNLEFHGRIDNQIKIRGFRVELEDIESNLAEIEEIIEAVVKPVKVEEGDYKLVAFINLKPDTDLTPQGILSILKQKLPPYMIPALIKFVSGFAKNINGKIDRKLLDVDILEFETIQREVSGVLTPTEKIILEIWGQMLKTKNIHKSDNFFDIGGNSLLAISTTHKIEAEFGVAFNIRNFFGSPSIAEQAAYIDIRLNPCQDKNRKDTTNANILEGEI